MVTQTTLLEFSCHGSNMTLVHAMFNGPIIYNKKLGKSCKYANYTYCECELLNESNTSRLCHEKTCFYDRITKWAKVYKSHLAKLGIKNM